MLGALHKHLLNDYQQDFPLTATPFQAIAEQLRVSEAEVLQAFRELDDWQQLSRIGAIVAPNRVGVSTLAAMAVSEDDLPHVAELINRYPEVNHNYQRENRYNLWFVLTAADQRQLDRTLACMEQQTGYPIMVLPMLSDYFINLGFTLNLDD